MTTLESPRRRGGYRAEQVVSTRWSDQDVYGHVNNVVYFSYVDTAVNGHLMAATGVDTRELDAIGVVAESQCTFRSEMHFPGDVVVGIGVTRLGNSSITYELGIFQGESDAPAATVRFVHVYVDRETRKTVAIPENIRKVAQALVL